MQMYQAVAEEALERINKLEESKQSGVMKMSNLQKEIPSRDNSSEMNKSNLSETVPYREPEFVNKKDDNTEKVYKVAEKSNYNNNRISALVDPQSKELLKKIVNFDIRKSMFKEVTNALRLYVRVLGVVEGGQDIDLTKYVEKAFEEKGYDVEEIDKEVDIDDSVIINIPKKYRDKIRESTNYDSRYKMKDQVDKAIDLYASVHQLLGDETSNSTKEIIEIVKEYSN